MTFSIRQRHQNVKRISMKRQKRLWIRRWHRNNYNTLCYNRNGASPRVWQFCLPPEIGLWVVGQDGILQADWKSAPARRCSRSSVSDTSTPDNGSAKSLTLPQSVTLIYAINTNRSYRSRQSLRAHPMADREDRYYAAHPPFHPRRPNLFTIPRSRHRADRSHLQPRKIACPGNRRRPGQFSSHSPSSRERYQTPLLRPIHLRHRPPRRNWSHDRRMEKIGPYRAFRILDPKPRLISAARFRDRVVHHALTNLVEPIFERRFVPYSFACRQGFGTHQALANARPVYCARMSSVFAVAFSGFMPITTPASSTTKPSINPCKLGSATPCMAIPGACANKSSRHFPSCPNSAALAPTGLSAFWRAPARRAGILASGHLSGGPAQRTALRHFPCPTSFIATSKKGRMTLSPNDRSASV